MLRVKYLLSFMILLICGLQIACSSDEKKSDTAEGAYAIAQEFEKDERFEEAIRRYTDVKNKFPYSKFATMAELSIADTYYKQESFPEAQVSYQTFKELHPKHPQIDYVTFRLGMSFHQQLPSTDDRDLTLAQSAILYFEELINQYPASTHLQEAKDKRQETLRKLGSKEMYIADFYFKKKQYDSALNRYEGLVRLYGDVGLTAEALQKAVVCAVRVGELDRAKQLLARLRRDFPDSTELRAAESEAQTKGI